MITVYGYDNQVEEFTEALNKNPPDIADMVRTLRSITTGSTHSNAAQQVAQLLMMERVPINDVLTAMPELVSYSGHSGDTNNVFPIGVFIGNNRLDLVEAFFKSRSTCRFVS